MKEIIVISLVVIWENMEKTMNNIIPKKLIILILEINLKEKRI